MDLFLADSFDDRGLEFAPIVAAKVEFVTREANRNGIAWFPFAGGVTISRDAFVFGGINDAFDVNDDGTANCMDG